MFSDPSLFNNEFFGRLFSFMGISDPMLLQLPMPGFISRLVIGLTLFGFAVDLLTTLLRILRKSVKY